MTIQKSPPDAACKPDKKSIVYEVIPTALAASIYIAHVRRKYFSYFWHHHRELEFTLVLKGRGTRMIGDSIEHFEERDLCLVGSNIPHCWFSEERQRPIGHCVVVQFLPDLLDDKIFTAPEFHCLRQLLTLARRGFCVVGATRTAVSARILDMSRRPAGHWEQLLDLLWVLGTLAGSSECLPLTTESAEPDTNPRDRQKINRILEITNVPPGELPSQKIAAETVRLSPAAFSRFFKRHMGKTYIDFVIDLRIAHVCRTLIQSETRITEIAFRAGFESLSNFNRQFRERKGTSPYEWRKLILKQRGH